MPQVQLSHGCLFYEERGTGAPLLLLPGLSRNLRHWNGFDQFLAAHFRVITFDFIGTGLSKGPGSLSVAEMAREVAGLMRALHIEKAHIVGLSLGGMVALSLGTQFPHHIASLFILNSSIGGVGQRRLEPAAWKAILESAIWKKQWLEKILPVVLGPRISEPQRQALQQAWQQIENEVGPLSSIVALRHFYAATQFKISPSIRELQIPSFILYGTEDRFVSPRNSKQLAQLLPHSQLIAIERGGHELPVESPQELAELVISYTK